MSIPENLLLSSNFLVNIGQHTFSFARIRNITDILETETVREGGDNWHVHSLAKQLSSAQKLTLERGLLAGSDGNTPVDLKPGTMVSSVTIMVMQRGAVKKSYYFDQGIVTKWDISDLDALQGQAVYRKVEITHSGLHEVNR